ncbi:hypothetical protein ACJMK2_011467 [Sinanodonta woodiana]|uniref:Uncharacterized protein n=1 Tax=Sinanodonta woodiana TaxID=1069815 RepID=A0ABD3V564_SINWO
MQTRKRDKGNEFCSDRNIKKMAQRAALNEIDRVPIKTGTFKNQNIEQSSGNKGNQNMEVKSEKLNVETPSYNKDYQKLVEKIEKLELELRQEQDHFARDCPLRIKKTRVQTHVPETKNGASKYPQRPAGGARNQEIHTLN